MKRNRLIAFALSISLLLGASACGKRQKTVSEADSGGKRHPRPAPGTVDRATALNSLDKNDNLSQSTAEHQAGGSLMYSILRLKIVTDSSRTADYRRLTDSAAKVRKLE